MSAPKEPEAFIPRVAVIEPSGTAARWWNQALEADRAGKVTRRRALLWPLGIGTGVVVVGAVSAIIADNDRGVDGAMEALELQRTTTWNVGDTDRPLVLADKRFTDSDSSEVWQTVMTNGNLVVAMAPGEERLKPYYVPTLFQAADRSPDLRKELFPILRPSMERHHGRARALAEEFEAAGRPTDTALVIDLPGPEAIAAAAALAEQFAPVFTFGNWPHPRGVVPAHETLGAALYYLPWFIRAASRRPAPAPPAFVLDANRLDPYRDEATHFDNRYTVSLPSADAMHALGVSRILYVRAGDSEVELDDLNADFAWLDGGGIPVRLASLADFELDGALAGGAGAGKVPDAGAPATATTAQPRYGYRYGSGTHVYFWHQYGWYQPAQARPKPGRVPPPAPPPSRAASYRPVARETVFSSRAVGGVAGIGKTKPSGFGRVSIRTSSGSGAISVRGGRSGSFGRGSFSSG